jgi:hypothetical protein
VTDLLDGNIYSMKKNTVALVIASKKVEEVVVEVINEKLRT